METISFGKLFDSINFFVDLTWLLLYVEYIPIHRHLFFRFRHTYQAKITSDESNNIETLNAIYETPERFQRKSKVLTGNNFYRNSSRLHVKENYSIVDRTRNIIQSVGRKLQQFFIGSSRSGHKTAASRQDITSLSLGFLSSTTNVLALLLVIAYALALRYVSLVQEPTIETLGMCYF